MTEVPMGKHSCQLAVGGEVVPVQDFNIEEDTDVMYIIPLDAGNYKKKTFYTRVNKLIQYTLYWSPHSHF